ncbi:MAG TPA: hypothetical protein VFK04_13060 [Gemmatimonadaceae bacterium]|nr:hypothetical protein [Gemmatimonadaceae bacterium]
MRLDTDSADLRAELAEAVRRREETERENAELRRRLAEMVEHAERPSGTYRPSARAILDTTATETPPLPMGVSVVLGVERVELPPIEWE